ncbi:hypothetical protein BHM03_00008034 [Ensete ventricosum]|nr:hypothetical protein BHM03_00008034 [Ensete ventricosum]
MLAARTPLCGSTGRDRRHTTFGARKRAANVTRALDAYQSWSGCPSRNPTNLGRSLSTPASIPSIRRREHTFPHRRRYWSLLNDPGLTPPLPNPRTPMSSSRLPATPLPQRRTTPPLNEPPPTTRSADDPLHFYSKSDQAPLGHATKQPELVPSASACNFSDPDTLSSDSIGSLREQLHLVNQRIDDVRRTLRTKDEHAEGPLCGSPFVQEIQDAHIPSHFRLPMLEAYDGSSDPMEHVAAFYAQMTLYGTSDVIMSRAFPYDSPRNRPMMVQLVTTLLHSLL